MQQFKDAQGRVRRQAARFRVLAFTENGLDDPGYQVQVGKEVTKLEWTVHVANKKAARYNFSELARDLMLGRRDQEFPWFSRASLAVLFSRKAVVRTTVLAS